MGFGKYPFLDCYFFCNIHFFTFIVFMKYKKIEQILWRHYANISAIDEIWAVITPKRRSLSQNAYFHGVIIPIYAHNFGYYAHEAKDLLKSLFLSYEKNNHTFSRQTSELTTTEFEDFCRKCREHASQEGCYIPLPNE